MNHDEGWAIFGSPMGLPIFRQTPIAIDGEFFRPTGGPWGNKVLGLIKSRLKHQFVCRICMENL